MNEIKKLYTATLEELKEKQNEVIDQVNLNTARLELLAALIKRGGDGR